MKTSATVEAFMALDITTVSARALTRHKATPRHPARSHAPRPLKKLIRLGISTI
jgi:hypothetical protein